MERMKIVINGADFSTIDGFYDEMDRVLTKDPGWRTGHNLAAFNDLLRGGFGVHEYGQPLELRWINAEKSRRDFGYEATADYWRKMLERCHPSNRDMMRRRIEAAEQGEGRTLFDIIVETILDTDNSGHDCTLVLDEERESEP